MNRKIFTFFLCAALFAMSCAATPVITNTSGKNEESLSVKRGQAFSIRLDSQLSTGFSWKAVEIPARLVLKDEKIKTEESGKTGGIDIQEFIFTAGNTGEAVILFKYGEHWKKNPEYIKTFKVNVSIK